MIDIEKIRSNISLLEASRTIGKAANIWEITKHDRGWLNALRRGRIIFQNTNMEYHYDDFSKIDYTGPENQNQEWRAQLNRFFWLRPITLQFRMERDECLAKIARETIEAWLDFRSYTGNETNASVAVFGDTTLSASIRLGAKQLSGWWGCIPYLCKSKYFDRRFIERMYDSSMEQLHFMRKNMSTLSNWRVSQSDTMFFLGYVLPDAAEYLSFAVNWINEAFHFQVEQDGSHIEHNGGYHVWMTEVFTAYALLMIAKPEMKLRIEPRSIIKMWDYYIHQYAPDGRTLGLNDDGRWCDKTPPVDVSKLVDSRAYIIERLGLKPADFPLSLAGIYPNAGQYYFRKSWADNSPIVTYDVTNYAGWHSHTARGSIQFFDGTRMLLLDPGSLNYDVKDPFTAAGKQTLMHNTVVVNDMPQLPFADARVDKISDIANASLAVSTYTGGYGCPEAADMAISARHTRSMMWIKDAFVFVVDTLTSLNNKYSFRSYWQMDTGMAKLTSNGAYTANQSGNVLVQAVECDVALNCKLYCGNKSPLLGYVAKDGERLLGGEPAPALGIEGSTDNSDTIFAQIIIPFVGDAPPSISSCYKEIGTSMYWEISIDDEKWYIAVNRHLLYGSALRTQIGAIGEIECDGLFAAVGEKDGNVFYAIGIDSNCLTYAGELLFEYEQAGDYEITLDRG